MRHSFAALTTLAFVLAVPAMAQTLPAPTETATPLKGTFKSPTGDDRGLLTLTPATDGVVLRVEVKGLTPGWHGLHFHEKGACSDEKFASAGGHVHGDAPVTHGLLNEDHSDAGDLPNLWVHADGTGAAEVYSSFVTAAAKDERPVIKDADGTAIVIHAMADDHISQPIGNAGARVACAVIE